MIAQIALIAVVLLGMSATGNQTFENATLDCPTGEVIDFVR